MSSILSIVILAIVFFLIVLRRIGNIEIQIWQAMCFGAIMVLILNQLSIGEAIKAINVEVMLFLFTMFIIGVSLEESGYLSHLTYKIFKKAKDTDQLFILILFVMGTASAFLMNDTIAIIGTPIMLHFARKHNIKPKILLMTLAFAVTIGSVFSPIGNPQNFLIATQTNLSNPFLTFFKHLFLPTIINLLVAFIILKLFYKDELINNKINHDQEPIKDKELAKVSKFAIILLIFLILLKVLFSALNLSFGMSIAQITTISCIPILAFSKKRLEIIKKVDWHTLIFFASMFVLMEAVWKTGFFQELVLNSNIDLLDIKNIFVVSIVTSQFISNVPFVALYLPILKSQKASIEQIMALAAGSTIAGNFLILGAASNIIIIQNAEKKSKNTINFFEFAKLGIPLTIVNSIIYWLFLTI